MIQIEHIFTIIIGLVIFYFADTIVDYVRYLPVFRSARDGQNPISFKIIGILIVIFGLGSLIYSLMPR